MGDSGLAIGVSAVLLDTRDGYRKAGIGRYVLRMIDGLSRRDDSHRYEVFVPKGMPLEQEWLDSKLRFHEVPFARRPQRVWWEYFHPPAEVRSLGLDAWFSLATGLPRPCAAKRVVMIHDLVPVLYPEFFKRRKAIYQGLALAYACRNADLVLTNSHATAEDIGRRYHRSGPTVVTPLGPGNEAHPVARGSVTQEELSRIGVPFERFLLTLGTLEPRKNLRRLIEAMALIRQSPGCGDIGLVVAGAHGWRESEIGANIERLGLADAVAFVGYVADGDLPMLFARCEAFVFPSLYEGFGIPILEAMQHGTPVLSSSHAALVEVGGDACRYFDPLDPSAIARCVAEFLRGADREAMSRAGLERSLAFNWKSTVDLSIQAIEKCCQPHSVELKGTNGS